MKNSIDFKNMHCVVVGASSGLGLAITKELLRRGAKVVAASRDIDYLLSLKKHSDRKIKLYVIKTDITDPHQINKLVSFSIKKLGYLNLLINTAGVALYKPFLSLTDSEIKTVINTNLIGAIMLIKKMLPVMLKSRGRKYIVQLGSLAGIKLGHVNFSVYSAAKEGLMGLFRSLVAEFREHHIKLILVCPAGVKTNIARNAFGAKEFMKKFFESNLDNSKDVAYGILDNLEGGMVDDGIRLLPTARSKQVYENL